MGVGSFSKQEGGEETAPVYIRGHTGVGKEDWDKDANAVSITAAGQNVDLQMLKN